ncbi:MAG: ABC transporter permease [Bradymonadales bacterium]|nr:ABC transporter permease [Bradymonadales bacterium]
MITRMAMKNLFRNRWRSALVMAGVGMATALLCWLISFIDGWAAGMIRGATSVQVGQVQVHSMEYVDRPTLYHHFAQDTALEREIEQIPGVGAIAPRCYAAGLIGHEADSIIARIVGVDPEREALATVITAGIVQGRWLSLQPTPLSMPTEVVLGELLATQLGVSVGSELVLFLQAADGALGNELVRVTGIIRTGNNQVDRQTVYMPLSALQYIAALDGRLHELALHVEDSSKARSIAEQIAGRLDLDRPGHPDELVVQSWQELMPEIAVMVELLDRSAGLWLFIVYLIVALGIFNAQRMSALERRREFGVLMALGLTPRQLGRVIITETMLLAVIGSLAGLVLGVALSAFHARFGLDLSAFSDQGTVSLMGISFTGRMYTSPSMRMVMIPLVWVVVMSLVCGIGPGVRSSRLDIPQAISGRS